MNSATPRTGEINAMATKAVLATRASTFALSEHRNLRFFVLFLLYFAQGMPFGLF